MFLQIYKTIPLFPSGLMPYVMKAMDYVNDPQLFDPDHPTRPHSH